MCGSGNYTIQYAQCLKIYLNTLIKQSMFKLLTREKAILTLRTLALSPCMCSGP